MVIRGRAIAHYSDRHSRQPLPVACDSIAPTTVDYALSESVNDEEIELK